MKHNGKTTHTSNTRRSTGRRSVNVAATVRSQADCSSANKNRTAARGSESTSRDLTVAATGNRGRFGGRRSHRTRIGKIARLPNEVREELNRRLHDGEPGDPLLGWLNALTKVQEILAAQFGGRPISKQNLSEWKQGGYRDWERTEEDRLRVERLTEQAARLAGPEQRNPLSERLAAVLLVELAGTLDDSRDESLPPAERWQLVRQMLREVAQMRREDHRAAKARIDQERWEWEFETLREEHRKRLRKEAQEKLSAPYEAAIQLPSAVKMFGGDKWARAVAARMLEIQHDLKPGALGGNKPLDPVKPCKAKPRSRSRARRRDASVRSGETAESSGTVRSSQTESNQDKPEDSSSDADLPASPETGVVPDDSPEPRPTEDEAGRQGDGQ